jgi:hypothetical protein
MTRKSIRLLYLIPFVLGLMFLGPWILLSMAFIADEAIRILFPERHPNYGTVELHVASNRVVFVSFLQTPEPGKFYLQIGNDSVEFNKLNMAHLTSIGFSKSKYSDAYFLPGEGFTRNGASSAVFSDNGLQELDICTTNILFSSSAEGPFLKVGCSFEEFKAQFGKPTSWRSITNSPQRWE